MTVFDEPDYGRCPKCGTKTGAHVIVRIQENRPSTRSVTRSRTFCTGCAEAIWKRLVDELKTEAGS